LGKIIKRIEGILETTFGTAIATLGIRWIWENYAFLPYVQRSFMIDLIATGAFALIFLGAIIIYVGLDHSLGGK